MKNAIQPIALVVCDLAGTTVDHGSLAPVRAFIELFRRHGVTVGEEEARIPMGKHKRDHIEEMLTMPAVAAGWKNAVGAAWTEADLDALFTEFLPLQTDILDDYSEVIPGAPEAFAEWRSRGSKIAATTGYNREMTDRVLAAAARQGLVFDFSCCAAEVPAGRPAPWMIFRCMEMAGVYPPSAVLSIGDTIADIKSGRNAGVWTVGVAKTGNMLGLSRSAVDKMPPEEVSVKLVAARNMMTRAGAHVVVDAIADAASVIPGAMNSINKGDPAEMRDSMALSSR